MPATRESLPAPELLTTFSMPGMEVFQVTTDPACPTHVFYNHREAYDPASRRVLLQRQRGDDTKLLLCDLADDFALVEVNPERTHESACFSPDGASVYYSAFDEHVLRIRRYTVATGAVEMVLELERARPEFGGRRISNGRWLSFSHDGRRLLTTTSLEGTDKFNSVCVFTFDMETPALHTSFETGPTNWNAKNQYAPCLGPEGEYLICANNAFGKTWFDAEGRWHCDPTEDPPMGSAEYLLDEAGEFKYAYPAGRDRPRQNLSHHDWFDAGLRQVFHVDAFDMAPHYRAPLMLVEPVRVTEKTRDLGRHIPGGSQLDLTRRVVRPDVCHICADGRGTRLVCDTIGYHDGWESYVYISTVKHDADGPRIEPAFLIHPKSSWKPYWCECIPSFTPDTRWVLFNSDYPGVNGYHGARHTPQVFACRGFEFPK